MSPLALWYDASGFLLRVAARLRLISWDAAERIATARIGRQIDRIAKRGTQVDHMAAAELRALLDGERRP